MGLGGRFQFQFELGPSRRWIRTPLTRALILKRFELEVKQSQPCSECSQCLSKAFFPPSFSSLLLFDYSSSVTSTLTQKYRNKGLGCAFVRASVGARGPHLTHTYEQMHPLYSGLLTPRAKALYKKMTFGCIRRCICSRS